MNKKFFYYLALILFLAFTGSSAIPVQNYFSVASNKDSLITIKNSFNKEEVRWFQKNGKGTINGLAKFRSRKGEIRFGKEFRVELLPFSLYAEERLGHIYPKNSGYVYFQNGVPKFTPDPKDYHDTKMTMCNEKGEFQFNNLPSGEYYIVAFMIWEKKENDGTTTKDGGAIMQRLKLSDGKIKAVQMKNF